MLMFHGSVIGMHPQLNYWYPPNVLTSFFYKEIKTQSWLDISRDPKTKIFLDSGAYTIVREKHPTVEELHKFVLKYRDFIVENYEYIYCFAELDVEQNYSQKQVDYWFDLLSEVDPEGKIIRVWHPNHSLKRWREYVESDLKFVGLGGAWQSSNVPLKHFITMIVHAYRNQTKVHGFGVTSGLLKKLPFFSVDSTLWLIPGRFGEAMIFNRRKGEMERLKSAIYVSRLKNKQEVPPDVFGNRYWKNRRACEEINKYVDYCTKLWTKKGINWNDI